jgi:hypothetical protein
MSFGPIDVYKQLPRTNCGECGHPSCLAFAIQVVGFGYDLANCPHLDARAREELGAIVTAQREKGVLLKRPSHQITREHLQEKITRCDFAASAPGLGAKYVRDGEVETLRLRYFGRWIGVSRMGLRADDGEDLDPWDQILIYNYIASSGSRPVSGRWVGMESFPNSLPKKTALEQGCHRRIAEAFAGDQSSLEKACLAAGGRRVEKGHNAELAYEIQALPKMPLLVLFWDQDREEGFGAKSKILFDDTAMEYLDLEGLVFVAEKLTDRLIT